MRFVEIGFVALAAMAACNPLLLAQTGEQADAPAVMPAECREKWRSLITEFADKKAALLRKIQPIAKRRETLMQQFSKLQSARQAALEKLKAPDVRTLDGFESRKLALELQVVELQEELMPLERQRIQTQQELIRRRVALAEECGLPPGALEAAGGAKGAAASSKSAPRKNAPQRKGRPKTR